MTASNTSDGTGFQYLFPDGTLFSRSDPLKMHSPTMDGWTLCNVEGVMCGLYSPGPESCPWWAMGGAAAEEIIQFAVSAQIISL